MWELKDKNKQKYNFIQFKYKKGDRVRTLNKNALFEKGTYEYSEELYTIDRIDGKRFYLVKNNGDQLGRGYLGYELMLVKNVLKNPDYDVFLTKANKELELQDLQQEQTERAINKELGKGVKENVIQKRLRDIERELVEDEFEIEKIVDCRKRNNRYEYLVKWKGYPQSANAWKRRDNSFRELYLAYDRSLQSE
eukprot:SAG31_NODE_1428_length_8391_cov_4.335866_2_plen_194_part_00